MVSWPMPILLPHTGAEKQYINGIIITIVGREWVQKSARCMLADVASKGVKICVNLFKAQCIFPTLISLQSAVKGYIYFFLFRYFSIRFSFVYIPTLRTYFSDRCLLMLVDFRKAHTFAFKVIIFSYVPCFDSHIHWSPFPFLTTITKTKTKKKSDWGSDFGSFASSMGSARNLLEKLWEYIIIIIIGETI